MEKILYYWHVTMLMTNNGIIFSNSMELVCRHQLKFQNLRVIFKIQKVNDTIFTDRVRVTF